MCGLKKLTLKFHPILSVVATSHM